MKPWLFNAVVCAVGVALLSSLLLGGGAIVIGAIFGLVIGTLTAWRKWPSLGVRVFPKR